MKKYIILLIFCVSVCCAILVIKDKVPNNDTPPQDDGSTLIFEQTTTTETPQNDISNNNFDIPSDISYTALNFENPKAMWFSYMDYSTILLDKSKEEFTQNIQERFNNAKNLGINTVYVQVRSHANSYYVSQLFPKAGYYNSDFDPLEIMVNIAHENGLSIHAWINPMRCMNTQNMDSQSNEYTIKQWYDTKKGTYINEYNDYWYLNPYYEDVRNFICEGVKEILNGYQIDGIHIDDYFYPTTDETFDNQSFIESGKSDLFQFRRDNVNSLVQQMYSTIKSINPTVEFGISPQGNIDKDLNEQCADVKLWTSTEGYCDYIVPQLYYGFNNSTCPFIDTLNAWAELNKNSSVKLIIGLCTYKIGSEDTWAGDGISEWIDNSNIVSSEIDYSLNNSDVEGVAIFDYGSTFEPSGSSDIVDKVNQERQSIQEHLN